MNNLQTAIDTIDELIGSTTTASKLDDMISLFGELQKSAVCRATALRLQGPGAPTKVSESANDQSSALLALARKLANKIENN